MGGIGSTRRKPPTVPIPQYVPPAPTIPPYVISRPPSPGGIGRSSLFSRKPKQNFPPQMGAMQRPGGIGASPYPYNVPPLPPPYGGQPSGYPPPSPLLRQLTGQPPPYPYQQPVQLGLGGYRDTDYAAVANIAGLNPTDVALLHSEYMNISRGVGKIDRVIFRQLLREAMIEANNENVDRAIENIFISIDRNRDGFIDFPEFVGAFRDILKGGPIDPQNQLSQNVSDLLNEQLRVNNVSPGVVCQPLTLIQQPQTTGQIISIPSTNIQQAPLVCGNANPLIISTDSNQSSYIANTQCQPTTYQCVSMM